MVLVVAIAAAFVARERGRTAVAIYRARDLPKLAMSGTAIGKRASVLFDFPLRPTADPLVWEYRPSLAGVYPVTVVVRFRSAPSGEIRSIVGVVSKFEYDIKTRMNSIPGFAVVTDAE